MAATLADRIRDRRDAARGAADVILTRAADEQRDLTKDELREYGEQIAQEREAALLDANAMRCMWSCRAHSARR
jgi:hypothetical protein